MYDFSVLISNFFCFNKYFGTILLNFALKNMKIFKNIRKAIAVACLMISSLALMGKEVEDSLLVMFWNLENFFDYHDGGVSSSDREFSSMGARRWTKSRFYSKCDKISKAVLWIADKYSMMPDVIGLCEVENRNVIYKLLNNSLLRKYDYQIVHYESSDSRGIDTALLFRESSFSLLSSSVNTPDYEGKKIRTRDILEVTLQRKGKVYHYLVNHHPSKFGGKRTSEGRRSSAMQKMKAVCDSIVSINSGDGIICMGDFNDTPDAPQFSIIEGTLKNKSLDAFEKGEGTIRFQGNWDLIDMFMVSPFLENKSVMNIVQIPFLMVWDNTHPGYKPFRTYSGPRYIGGVSDHCPIVLQITF